MLYEYNEDLLNDIDELKHSILMDSKRAALCLSGRILEVVLKCFLKNRGVEFDQNIMVGALLGKINNAGIYLDSSLKNICNIINQQRIIGVHKKEKVPIPSQENVYMVVYAVIDTVKRIAVA